MPRPRKRLTIRDQIVGDVLRRARIGRGLSQKEAAEAFGLLPQAFISKVERGARHVHAHELERFAALYAVSVRDLEVSIAHGIRLADADPRRVRKTRPKRRVVEHPREAGLFIEVPFSGGGVGTDQGHDYSVSVVGDDAPPIDGLLVSDGWPLVEVGGTEAARPHPLRPKSVPFVIPSLSLADWERRARLSVLVREDAEAALQALTVEWLPVIDAYGPEGTTALYEAVAGERLGCVEALVALGANPFRVQCFPWAADSREVTAFNAAIHTSQPGRLLRALCAARVDPPATEGWEQGPIHWAALEALPHGEWLAAAVKGALPIVMRT